MNAGGDALLNARRDVTLVPLQRGTANTTTKSSKKKVCRRPARSNSKQTNSRPAARCPAGRARPDGGGDQSKQKDSASAPDRDLSLLGEELTRHFYEKQKKAASAKWSWTT
ncbi:hypothetical protein MASR1M42_15210 [Azonexus hydrophilus]